MFDDNLILSPIDLVHQTYQDLFRILLFWSRK